MCALVFSIRMTPDRWLTEYLDHILSSGDTLYHQIGKFGQLFTSDITAYMWVYNCQCNV